MLEAFGFLFIGIVIFEVAYQVYKYRKELKEGEE